MSRTIERSAIVPYSAQKMFDLVNDIETYPQFMTGCVSAKVLERSSDHLVARLELGKGGLTQSFTTRNELRPPEVMTMKLVDGPFKIFQGTWQFTPLNESSCEVRFHLEYQFSNFLLDAAAGGMMNQTAADQVQAVCERAKALYS